MALSEVESATRCILYPDTTVCGLSTATNSPSPTPSCRLVIKEPAPQVYLRTGEPIVDRVMVVGEGGAKWHCLPTGRMLPPTSISLPGHGTLQGVVQDTNLGSGKKTVVHYLGVPYARPPIGSLRFKEAQPADWTGTWDATKPR